MPNVNDDINHILKIEGGLVNDPVDKGGETNFGISKVNNPEAWADGKVTADEARAIYMKKYVVSPGFDKIVDANLQAQLIDYSVNSGAFIAIQKLQGVLNVTPDGVLGPTTLTALSSADAHHVNNALVVARIKMIGKIISKNPTQLKFINGWLDRALQFLV